LGTRPYLCAQVSINLFPLIYKQKNIKKSTDSNCEKEDINLLLYAQYVFRWYKNTEFRLCKKLNLKENTWFTDPTLCIYKITNYVELGIQLCKKRNLLNPHYHIYRTANHVKSSHTYKTFWKVFTYHAACRKTCNSRNYITFWKVFT
jgi:hypothetical protein